MRPLGQAQKVFLLFVVITVTVGMLVPLAAPFVHPTKQWLSQKGTGNNAQATAYYESIEAPGTLGEWKAKYGFDGVDETRAVYYNSVDLGLGRDMHCRRFGEVNVACYLVNHGFGPAGPAGPAIEDAIADRGPLATVAMVYDKPEVSFYVYAPDGSLAKSVALDSEGPKFIPQMCMSCHGGPSGSAERPLSGASFLPFDLESFEFSAREGFTRDAQEEKFRRLNHMVRDTSPPPRIKELIDGWYADTGGVYRPGATQDNTFVPPEWRSNAEDRELYERVVEPSCRTCHIAQGVDLGTPAQMNVARHSVFNGFYMPNAERTSHLFWATGAPAFLANNRGWSFRVTRLDDPKPDGCKPGDCSLREATLAANALNRTSSDRPIITFDVNGTFLLTRRDSSPRSEEDGGATGDLDVARQKPSDPRRSSPGVLIIGNGAANTIINGDGVGRVIESGDFPLAIQRVMIRGGETIGKDQFGGGIQAHGALTLDRSVITGNSTARLGGGISANCYRHPRSFCSESDRVTITNSAILNNRAGEDGGGIFYSSLGQGLVHPKAHVTGTTIANNCAGRDGGGIQGGPIDFNHSTIALNCAGRRSGGIGAVTRFTVARFVASIVAGNRSGDGRDCGSGAESLGGNLVGQDGSSRGCPMTDTDLMLAGDIGTAIEAAPIGEVPAHPPVVGSQAIDAIPPNFALLSRFARGCAPPSYDQRDLQRPQEGDNDLERVIGCDIGAFEVLQTPHVNLLRNPSFETDADDDGRPDSWTPDQTFTRTRIAGRVTGFFVGQFSATDDSDGVVRQTVAVRPDKTYRFGGWLNIPATDDDLGFALQVFWLDASGTVVGQSFFNNRRDDTGGRWEKVTANLDPSRGAVKARLEMGVTSLNATIYVDHFEFRPG